jgi:hypothetical protein
MAPMNETEARYRVAELVKKHPRLSDQLFKLQSEGADWVRLLEELQRVVGERPGGDSLPQRHNLTPLSCILAGEQRIRHRQYARAAHSSP